MAIFYNATNSANWLQIWTGHFTAQPVPHPSLSYYYPIEDIDIPIQIESELIAIHAQSIQKEKNNKLIGWANPKIHTGITTGGIQDTVLKGQKIFDNQISLCRFPKLYSSSYSISIHTYWWVREINYTAWIYTGDQLDTYENKLDEIISLVS